jgi:very-short-patch-repair endonuclease
VPTESASAVAYRRSTRTRDLEAGISRLAERQYGVVSRLQLRKCGLKESAIDRRQRAGRLHLLHPAVFSVGHRVIPREGRWMAAILASGPGAVLSHWSAAHLWMIRPNSRSRIDVTVAHRSRSSKPIRRHISDVPDDERTVAEGIPVTTVPRTILDLAATEDSDTVEDLLRESERLRLTDRLSLPDLLERYRGKRGTRKVQAALDRIREEPVGHWRSKLEERFAPFLRWHRLPLPRFNDWIFLGGRRYKVDCHWPNLHQIVELDGWETHSTRTAFREDRARDRRLTAAGYSIAHITWNQLDDEPDEVASDLRSLLLRDR